MLGDTEAEVAGLGEVALAQLVLLDLQATLENLLSLWAADGDVNGDLFVTADTEGADGVASLACIIISVVVRRAEKIIGSAEILGWIVRHTVNRSLSRKLLEDLCRSREPIT